MYDWIMMTLGCAVFAVAISVFLEPPGIAPGGASGIAIIVNGMTGFPTGTAIFLINIPLLILGMFGVGREFAIKSVYATVMLSLMTNLTSYLYANIPPLTTDPFLCGMAGGVLAAVGMSTVFRHGGSTGGTDIIAKLIRKKRRDVPTGKIFLAVDSMIVAASAIFSHNVDSALYAAVTLFVTTKVLDILLYGTDEAKFLVIISSEPENVAEGLLREIDCGVTYANGYGGYTGIDKKIILCAVKKHNYPRVKDMVNSIDPSAFMIVTSASEVYGEGYKMHGAEEL